MRLKAYWAYDFVCDLPLEAILERFNEVGPWRWQLRESAWYGDYLNARPTQGVRVRIHAYPYAGAGGVFVGLRAAGFSALLHLEAACPATEAEVDAVFRGLLLRVDARGLTEIEPYD